MNRNSRRLRGAADRIDQEVEWFRTRARTLSVDQCEGDAALHSSIQTKLRLAAETLILRFKYLKTVPWCFVRADSVEGAAEFLRGATSRPSEEQDPLTNYLLEKHRASLVARANGEECTPGLKDDVSRMDEVPLDESAGEGYHRSTHHTLVRASASTSVYIKQSTRTKKNIQLLKRFLRMGPAGKQVIRFEWRVWKRVLQVKRASLWTPKGRMNRDAVFKRIYRMDEAAELNWSLFGDRVLAPGQGLAPEPLDNVNRQYDGLRIEYLQYVLKTKQWYSVELPRAAMSEVGLPIERKETQYFQIVAMTSCRSRPSLVSTFETRDDVSQRARLALCLQYVDARPGVEVPGQVIVFASSDPMWVRWTELGFFPAVRNTLKI